MAIDRKSGSRRVIPSHGRNPLDVAADARINQTIRQLPAFILKRTEFHLCIGGGRAGERAFRTQLAEIGVAMAAPEEVVL